MMGSANDPPPARLPSRGGKAAPVTSLSDPSPTRSTPVKREPRPLPAALPSFPTPDPCQPPPGAPPPRGGRGGPSSRRDPARAETRPRLDAAAPADAPPGRPSRALAAATGRLAHLTRGRSSGPLSCSGSSSGCGGGGGGGGGGPAPSPRRPSLAEPLAHPLRPRPGARRQPAPCAP